MASIKLYIRDEDQQLIDRVKKLLDKDRKSMSEFFIDCIKKKLGIKNSQLVIKELEQKIKNLEHEFKLVNQERKR